MSETQFSPAMERFFEELRKTPRDWGFYTTYGSRLIRWRVDKAEQHACPVCAVANCAAGRVVSHLCWSRQDVLSFAILSRGEAISIVMAADEERDHNPAIRARLLECCGLEEVANG